MRIEVIVWIWIGGQHHTARLGSAAWEVDMPFGTVYYSPHIGDLDQCNGTSTVGCGTAVRHDKSRERGSGRECTCLAGVELPDT